MSEDRAPAGEHAPDAATALGLAVVLLALAGISALLGGHFLLGALRLAAGVLAGAGLGVLLIALLGGRLRRRTRTLLAAGLALVVALALTVPAVLATRVDVALALTVPGGQGPCCAAPPPRSCRLDRRARSSPVTSSAADGSPGQRGGHAGARARRR